jgi:hypothetical protein
MTETIERAVPPQTDDPLVLDYFAKVRRILDEMQADPANISHEAALGDPVGEWIAGKEIAIREIRGLIGL